MQWGQCWRGGWRHRGEPAPFGYAPSDGSKAPAAPFHSPRALTRRGAPQLVPPPRVGCSQRSTLPREFRTEIPEAVWTGGGRPFLRPVGQCPTCRSAGDYRTGKKLNPILLFPGGSPVSWQPHTFENNTVNPYTWAEKFESFEQKNSIRETNVNFDSCNSCKWLVPMSCMSQNFCLFHLSNLSVRNFRIFLLMYTGSVTRPPLRDALPKLPHSACFSRHFQLSRPFPAYPSPPYPLSGPVAGGRRRRSAWNPIRDASCRAHNDGSAPTVGSALRSLRPLCLGRWLAMPIFGRHSTLHIGEGRDASPWPITAPLATSTSGHFELWPFQPLATSSSGHFNLWPLRSLATSTSGHFDLWPIQPLATSSSGHFNLWPLRALATSTSGQFELWPLQPLAFSSSGPYEFTLSEPLGHFWPIRPLDNMNSRTLWTHGHYELWPKRPLANMNLWTLWYGPAEEHPTEGCSRPPRCAACDGPHTVTDPKCPQWAFEREVCRTAATQHIPPTEARAQNKKAPPLHLTPQHKYTTEYRRQTYASVASNPTHSPIPQSRQSYLTRPVLAPEHQGRGINPPPVPPQPPRWIPSRQALLPTPHYPPRPLCGWRVPDPRPRHLFRQRDFPPLRDPRAATETKATSTKPKPASHTVSTSTDPQTHPKASPTTKSVSTSTDPQPFPTAPPATRSVQTSTNTPPPSQSVHTQTDPSPPNTTVPETPTNAPTSPSQSPCSLSRSPGISRIPRPVPRRTTPTTAPLASPQSSTEPPHSLSLPPVPPPHLHAGLAPPTSAGCSQWTSATKTFLLPLKLFTTTHPNPNQAAYKWLTSCNGTHAGS